MRTAAANKSLAGVRSALDRLEEQDSNRSLYDRLRYPNYQSFFTLPGCVVRAMRAETERSLVLCAIALKRYALKHQGASPPALESLVPDFLPSVPTDYMDGKPMKFRVKTDGSSVLYSVGEDGKDNGGDASLAIDKSNRRDLWSRKDLIWPAPATPEETEAFREAEK